VSITPAKTLEGSLYSLPRNPRHQKYGWDSDEGGPAQKTLRGSRIEPTPNHGLQKKDDRGVKQVGAVGNAAEKLEQPGIQNAPQNPRQVETDGDDYNGPDERT
jgi:hypothetical protein